MSALTGYSITINFSHGCDNSFFDVYINNVYIFTANLNSFNNATKNGVVYPRSTSASYTITNAQAIAIASAGSGYSFRLNSLDNKGNPNGSWAHWGQLVTITTSSGANLPSFRVNSATAVSFAIPTPAPTSTPTRTPTPTATPKSLTVKEFILNNTYGYNDVSGRGHTLIPNGGTLTNNGYNLCDNQGFILNDAFGAGSTVKENYSLVFDVSFDSFIPSSINPIYSVNVPGNTNWRPGPQTNGVDPAAGGLALQSGVTYSISANGSVNYGYGQSVGPDGGSNVDDSLEQTRGFPGGSLVGVVVYPQFASIYKTSPRNNSFIHQVFYIGSSCNYTPTINGTLFFGIVDSDTLYVDNTGSFNVNIYSKPLMKIVDFSDRASDAGIYSYNGQLLLYPLLTTPSPSSPYMKPKKVHRIILTRSSNNAVNLYLDGVLAAYHIDWQNYAVASRSPNIGRLSFGIDDIIAPNQTMRGGIYYIATYSDVAPLDVPSGISTLSPYNAGVYDRCVPAPSPTRTITPTPTRTPDSTPTRTPTTTQTKTPTQTTTPTKTTTLTPTATPTKTVTNTPTATVTPSIGAYKRIDTTLIGDRSNESDTNQYGSVTYEYKVGTYEITNAQYADFLNAVAVRDPNGLYSSLMQINRFGEADNYFYIVKSGFENHPVVGVLYINSLRFVNWIHNKKPSGFQSRLTTEDGAYSLLDDNDVLKSVATVTRNSWAECWLPNENEWYKAAFFRSGSSSATLYFDYTINGASSVPSGTRYDVVGNNSSITPNTDNTANINNISTTWTGKVGRVGFNGGRSYFEAYDMTGNVAEWVYPDSNDITIDQTTRGGSWKSPSFDSVKRQAYSSLPSLLKETETDDIGFRIASLHNYTDNTDIIGVLGANHFATVTNPFNNADILTGLGRVDYQFRIGKNEITNDIYTIFLNSVAALSDRNGLYNASMSDNVVGGILRSGTEGNYVYSVKENMNSRPVVFVSFFDVLRFCNWLHNGAPANVEQNNFTTETGAYTLTPSADGSFNVTRNNNAYYWLPYDNEWYKVAYYRPSSFAYTTYATGDSITQTTNFANYSNSADWNSQDGNVTTVASNGGVSAYGTYDQTGNVSEFVDNIFVVNSGIVLNDTTSGSIVYRGGSFSDSNLDVINKNYRSSPTGINSSFDNVGFRISTIDNPLNINDFVLVGNPNNIADTNGYGSVDYSYRILSKEITNTQYAEFLNAQAKSIESSSKCYNTLMSSSARGGISRTGSGTTVAPYVYSVKTNMGDKPVNFVTSLMSIRYTNWLHNYKPVMSNTNLPATATPTLTPTPTATSRLPDKISVGWTLSGQYVFLNGNCSQQAGGCLSPSGDLIIDFFVEYSLDNGITWTNIDHPENYITYSGAVPFLGIPVQISVGTQFRARSKNNYGYGPWSDICVYNGVVSDDGTGRSYCGSAPTPTPTRTATPTLTRTATPTLTQSLIPWLTDYTSDNGAYSIGIDGNNITVTKNSSARYYLSTENEWYKAAYHKGGSIAGNYWSYATQNNGLPVRVTSSNIGVGVKPTSYIANLTSTGAGGTTSTGFYGVASAYGTYDQTGNAYEWIEAPNATGNTNLILRGGSYQSSYGGTGTKTDRVIGASNSTNFSLRQASTGFRIAAKDTFIGPEDIAYPVVNTRINVNSILINNEYNNASSTSYGSVAYKYRIGKSSVTNEQYCAFLNAIASINDRFNLYVADMTNYGDLTRYVVGGRYFYNFRNNTKQRPITNINWFNAARFCNWMHNDQPVGLQSDRSTEKGSYDLSSFAGTTTEFLDYPRGVYAKCFIPTEDEWYKAAYFDPFTQDTNTRAIAINFNDDRPLDVGTDRDLTSINFVGGSVISPTAGLNGTNAVRLSASSDKITINNSSVLNIGFNNFNIQFVVQISETASSTGRLLELLDAQNNVLIRLSYSNNNMTLSGQFLSSSLSAFVAPNYIYNSWHHISIYRFGDTTYLYLNNNLMGKIKNTYLNINDLSLINSLNMNNISIGGFVGYIDSLFIENGIMTFNIDNPGYQYNDEDKAITGQNPGYYWTYPTYSDACPNPVLSTNIYNDPDFSGKIYPGNFANYGSKINKTVTLNSSNTTSFYGVEDLAGNVWEWTEGRNNSYRSIVGGDFNSNKLDFDSKNQYLFKSLSANNYKNRTTNVGYGFRICFTENFDGTNPFLPVTPTPSSTKVPYQILSVLEPSRTPTRTVTPTATPTNTISPTVTPTSTIAATPSNTPTFTPTESPTPTITPSMTETPTQTPTPTPTPEPTPSNTPTMSVTPTETVTPTVTASSTVTPSVTNTSSPTPTPTLTPGLVDVLRCMTYNTAVSDSGGNYNFTFTEGSPFDPTNINHKLGYGLGTYILTNVPSAHPIAILNSGYESFISYSGNVNNKLTKIVNGVSYDFYHGNVIITVNGVGSQPSVLSYYCYYHGYMGGENRLMFNSLCNPTPTPTPTQTTTPTVTPTQSLTPTNTPTITTTPTFTPTNTASVTPTNTLTPTETPTNTLTPTVSPSFITSYDTNLSVASGSTTASGEGVTIYGGVGTQLSFNKLSSISNPLAITEIRIYISGAYSYRITCYSEIVSANSSFRLTTNLGVQRSSTFGAGSDTGAFRRIDF